MDYIRSFLIAGLFLIAGYHLYSLSKNPAKRDYESFTGILKSTSISEIADMGNKIKAKGSNATELEKEALFKKSCQFFEKVHEKLSSTKFHTENAKKLQAQFLNQKSSIDQSCKELDKENLIKNKSFISQTNTNASGLIVTIQASLAESAKSFSLKDTVVGKLHLPLFLLIGLMLLLAMLNTKKPNNWINDSLLISLVLVGFSDFFSRQLGALYVLPALSGFIYLCYLLLKQQKAD